MDIIVPYGVCANCGKSIDTFDLKKHPKKKYCCRECMAQDFVGRRNMKTRGVNHHNFKGGFVNGNGYRLIWVDGRSTLEHRHIMSVHIGRPLTKNEIVHHIDGNRLNNSLDNLELIKDQSTHGLLHYGLIRTETHKQCSKCLAILDLSNFHKGSKHSKSVASACKKCSSEYSSRRWREKNRLNELPAVN